MQTQKGMITLLVGLICVLALFLMTQKPPGAAEDRPAPDAPLMLNPKRPTRADLLTARQSGGAGYLGDVVRAVPHEHSRTGKNL